MESELERIKRQYEEAANNSLQAQGFSPWTWIARKSAEIPMWTSIPRGWGETPEMIQQFEGASKDGMPTIQSYRHKRIMEKTQPAMDRLKRYNSPKY